MTKQAPSPNDQSSFAPAPSFISSDALEQEILDYWRQERIFEKSLKQTKTGPLFTFYDGPPYATGTPHYGHILQSAIKDTVLRSKTMQGYYVPRTVGWDCHGLPIETIVEKELKFKSKRDIEEYGLAAFNERCRQTVTRYIDVFTATLRRLGRWADYEHGYFTMDTGYIEKEWGVFQQLWHKNLVYKSFRSTPYCIRCATPLSNFEVSMAYKDKVDTAIYIALPIYLPGMRRANQQPRLLIWTTTPWTLPGNAAVAINPAIAYVSVDYEGQELIIARDRVKVVFGEEAKIRKDWPAADLLKLTYSPPYGGGVGVVIASDHVTTSEGTGLVHIAPAFGEEDYELGKQHDLPVLPTIDAYGKFVASQAIPAPLQNLSVFDANLTIIEDLRQRGLLFKQESYQHSYPFCWRCDTPLIYYALETWFVRVTELTNDLLAANEPIHWIPTHVKHGRFAKGIQSAPDWAISRNRFWSVPMPVWECDQCHHQVCVGSIAELKKLSGQKEIKDLHRPYVDTIAWSCGQCPGTMRRIPEVLDVWFDSGSMPYATAQPFPADFIAESIEMTRAWFYVLHVLAVALKDQPAYKNVIASGLIFAADGQKLSKKLKNYPEIEPTLKTYGADVLRFYLITSASLGEPYRFSEKEMRHLKQNTYNLLWNVYSFFTRYANAAQWAPHPPSLEGEAARRAGEVLDAWLLARFKQLQAAVGQHSDAYEIDTAARAFIPFIDDLSNWYVRRSRNRFQEGEDAAFANLYHVLVALAKLLAPFMPFVSEAIYRNLTGGPSVHLEKSSAAPALDAAEQQLVAHMAQARQIVSQALAARAAAKIKVRQPLAILTAPIDDIPSAVLDLVKDEVNVKAIEAGSALRLDTKITPALRAEGIAREIIRHGQLLRRQANYALNDRIDLIFRTDNKDVQTIFETQLASILEALQADGVTSDGPEDAGQDLEVEGAAIHLGVRKLSQ